MQASPWVFCQSHPSMPPALAGWTRTGKGDARACFPRGNVIYFRCLQGGCLTPVFPSQSYSTPCFWVWASEQESLCCKIPHTRPSSVSVHYADAPVPRKVILALSFLSRVSSGWHGQSNHIVNDLHEGRCHCDKTRGQNKAEG